MVYRFKIRLEDNDEFLREICVQSNQTFADFHLSIIDCTTLKAEDSAAFYVCNDNWLKETKITTEPVNNEEDTNDIELLLANRKRKKVEEFDIKTALLKNFIQDPHQKMIYESNLEYPKTFYIELTKITKEDPKTTYPTCSNKIGEIPAAKIKPVMELQEFDTSTNTQDEMALIMAGLTQKISKLDDIDDIPDDFMDADLEAIINADLSDFNFDDVDTMKSIRSRNEDDLDEEGLFDEDDEFAPDYDDGDPFGDNEKEW